MNPYPACGHEDPSEHPQCDRCWWDQTHDEEGRDEWPHCGYCREPGHETADCPEAPAEPEGTRA